MYLVDFTTHGSRPFTGIICSSVLCFRFISFCSSYFYVRQTKLVISLVNFWTYDKIVIKWLIEEDSGLHAEHVRSGQQAALRPSAARSKHDDSLASVLLLVKFCSRIAFSPDHDGKVTQWIKPLTHCIAIIFGQRSASVVLRYVTALRGRCKQCMLAWLLHVRESQGLST